MKIFVSIFGVSIFIVIGCAFFQYKNISDFPPCEVTVAGDTIYCSGKPFAKLWSISSHCYTDDKLFSTDATSGLGLAIHYYNSDKDVWIYPEKGLSVFQDGKQYPKIEDMQRVWDVSSREAREYYNAGHGMPPQNKLPVFHNGGKAMGKEDLIRSVVLDVRIRSDNDGVYVYYEAQGMLWNSSCEYLVELKPVGR